MYMGYGHRSIVWKYVFLGCTYLIKTKILLILGTAYFLKIAKINSQQEKPICQISSRKTQKIANPQKQTPANFVPHGMYPVTLVLGYLQRQQAY